MRFETPHAILSFVYGAAGLAGFCFIIFVVAMLELLWDKAHKRRVERDRQEFASRMSVAAYNKNGPCTLQCIAECDGGCTKVYRELTQ